MDKFNSLDALVAESKKEFHMLIKFGSLENLERFQGGSLYMKNLRFYNELECEPGNGKPDKYDGKWRMNGGSSFLQIPTRPSLSHVVPSEKPYFLLATKNIRYSAFFVVMNVIAETIKLIKVPALFLFRSLPSKCRN